MLLVREHGTPRSRRSVVSLTTQIYSVQADYR